MAVDDIRTRSCPNLPRSSIQHRHEYPCLLPFRLTHLSAGTSSKCMERRIYDNTEDLKESNCDLRIRNSKMEEETQLWLRRLRDEAYVDVVG